MAEPARVGPFWDMIEGRAPAPPAARLLGWRLEAIDPVAGTVRVQFDAREDFLNPVGMVQGGLLVAMLDDTMGPAAAATLGGAAFAQTLELNTSFLRPAKPGKLYGAGRVVHRGRDIMFIEGTLSDVIATASATGGVVGGGLGGPLRCLPLEPGCAGKARARNAMSYTAYSVSWNLTQCCNLECAHSFASEGAAEARSDASPRNRIARAKPALET